MRAVRPTVEIVAVRKYYKIRKRDALSGTHIKTGYKATMIGAITKSFFLVSEKMSIYLDIKILRAHVKILNYMAIFGTKTEVIGNNISV